MSKRYRYRGILLFLCILLLGGMKEIRASADEYSYELIFYAGNRGRFTSTEGIRVIPSGETEAEIFLTRGGNAVRVRGLMPGDVVTFDAEQNLELTEGDRYYIKGIRLSGRDNNTVSLSAVSLTGEYQKDMDYVVAYGIRGEMTAYHVRYEDSAGRELAPARTYYGNVGDRPVVAFLYVDGYVPQAYNLTKTLSKNEAENIFTFVYNPIRTGEENRPGSSTVTAERENNPAESETNNTENAEADNLENTGVDNNQAANDETANLDPAQADAETQENTQEGPQELLNLDDEEVPLSMQEGEPDGENAAAEDTENDRRIFYLEIFAACIAGLTLFLLVIWWRRRKKEDPEEEKERDKA